MVIFDNDQDDRLLVVQEAAAEAMTSAVYDGPLACVRVRAAIARLPPPSFPPRPPDLTLHRHCRSDSGNTGLAFM